MCELNIICYQRVDINMTRDLVIFILVNKFIKHKTIMSKSKELHLSQNTFETAKHYFLFRHHVFCKIKQTFYRHDKD